MRVGFARRWCVVGVQHVPTGRGSIHPPEIDPLGLWMVSGWIHPVDQSSRSHTNPGHIGSANL
eukprot:1431240-Prymnesium_polylepis.1